MLKLKGVKLFCKVDSCVLFIVQCFVRLFISSDCLI